jgi:hypothetical protein
MNRKVAFFTASFVLLIANEGQCNFDFTGVPHPNLANAPLSATSSAHSASPAFAVWGYDPAQISRPPTTHIVDSSDPSCSDSNNGTPSSPFCSIPTALGPGDVLEIRGGPYTGPLTVQWSGSVDRPIFVHGAGVISGVSENRWALNLDNSTHVILDGLTFDGSTIPRDQALGNGAFAIRNSDHITIRNCVVRNYPDPSERTDRPGQSIFFVNLLIQNSNYVAITGCHFEDIGTFPPKYETGKHIIGGGSNAHFVWITANTFINGSEDAIQIRALNTMNTFWFVSGNYVERMGENAFDIKTGEHIVLSENTATIFPTVTFANGSGSDGAAVVFNDDDGGPRNSWLVNNVFFDVGVGFRMQSQAGTNYVFGNEIWGTRGNCVYIGSGSVPVIENNSLYECGLGGLRILFSGESGGSVTGNIISTVGAGEYHLQLNQRYMDDWAKGNVVYQPGGSVRVSSNVTSASNELNIDPNFLIQNATNRELRLAAKSVAIDLLIAPPTSLEIFSQRFGVAIDKDTGRNPRLHGSKVDAGAFEFGDSAVPSAPILE